MNQNIGLHIYKLRSHLNLSQEKFGALVNSRAINISRYERNEHPVPSHTLLKLGLLAKQAGMDGWVYWERVGLTQEDARAALAQARAAAAGR